jgi:uncharacterized protein
VNRALAASLLAIVAATALADGPDPERMASRGEELLDALREERSVRAVRTFDSALRTELPPPRLTATWRQLTGALGRPLEWKADAAASGPSRRAYDLTLERGRVRVTLDFSAAGEVTAFSVARPLAQAPPGRGGMRGLELSVGPPPVLVPATLLLPAGAAGKVPAALLLGDLDADREGAHGTGRRPLRDLAEALAARGVATLRIERRTVTWPGEGMQQATVEVDVIMDAVAALKQLRDRPEIDPARIFVVGHGLGGILAPEIAERGAPVAAVVLAGAPAHTLPAALLDVARAEQKLPPGELARYEKLGERALSNRLEEDETFHHRGDAFWRDLATRDPMGHVRHVLRPLLVLRGEKDLLCNADDLTVWRSGLRGVEGVTLETLPGLDHDLAEKGAERTAPAALKRVADFLLAAPAAEPRPPAAAAAPGRPGTRNAE